MEELLNKLKKRVEDLLDKHVELRKAHQTTQEKQQSLASEKKLLQEKHHMAISQIERMIARLKLLEKAQL